MNQVNFLIVGAAKSGTTSIYNYLIQHPEIFMPKCKEPHFLIKNKISQKIDNYIKSYEDYNDLFLESNHQINGEASVFYLYYYEEAIKNIHKYLGKNIKILIVLRKPSTRAFSAYRYVKKAGKEQNSFIEGIKLEKERKDIPITPMTHYISCSMYYEQVKAYIDNFQYVKVVFFEDFLQNKNQTLKQICSFIEVSDNFNFNTSNIHNANENDWKFNTKYTGLFTKDNTFKRNIKSMLQKNTLIFSLCKKVFDSIFIEKKKTKLSDEEESELSLLFENDIKKLERLLSKNLDIWREKK